MNNTQDNQWLKFKEDNPEMEQFFKAEFKNIDEFEQAYLEWQDKYCQLLKKGVSTPVPNLGTLSKDFKYQRCQLLCTHSGKFRTNKKDNSRETTHTKITGCQFEAILKLKGSILYIRNIIIKFVII